MESTDINEVLFLFASNSSPLYEQDVLDVLASPRGQRQQLRYSKSWIEDRAMTQWLTLPGTSALVNFALQQKAEYHDPAFIPIREAIVVSTAILGDIYVVELELTDYVSLVEKSSGEPREVYGPAVKRYGEELLKRKIPRPYKNWAGLGQSVRDLFPGSSDETGISQMLSFERTVVVLGQTESFEDALFVRVLNIREGGVCQGSDLEEGLGLVEGQFILRAGRSYQLLLSHVQPKGIEAKKEFLVSVDDSIIRLIGRPSFEISSRYDFLRLNLHAVQGAVDEHRETVVAIDPAPGVQGPRIRLAVVVLSDIRRTTIAVGGSAAAAILLGVPAILPSLATSWKFSFVLAATLLFGVLTSMGLKRG